MPHTWIVWVYAQSVHSHIAIQEMSAVRLIPWSRKLPHFQQGQSENTFYMSAIYPIATQN